MKRILKTTANFFVQYKSIFLLLLLIFIGLSSNKSFATLGNVTNILQQIAPVGIAAVGLTLVAITGGFDMSIGSVMSLTGVITMMGIRDGISVGLSIGLGLLIGLGAGFLNGVLIALVGINPFISTLATQILIKGIALGITNTYPITLWNKTFGALAMGRLGFLPYSFLTVIILAIVYEVYLKKTRSGHYIYIAGSNREAGWSAGINMNRTLILAHTICGVTASIGGIFLASKLGSGSPVVAGDASLTAMTAIIIGGNKLTGSKANMLRTIIGVLILGILNNMMNLMGTMSYYQTLIRGAIVIFVIAMDAEAVKSILARVKYQFFKQIKKITAKKGANP